MNRARLLLAAAVLALYGCETPIPDQRIPDLTFGHFAPLRLDVAVVEVVADFHSPLAPPNIEHMFPTSPEKALRQWAKDRLRAGGAAGRARFAIVNAAVTETPMTIDRSFAGVFKKEQSERYDATLEASLEILDGRGFRRGFATARVTRSTTVREDISLLDREREWFALVEGLMGDFDAEIERNIRQYLGGLMR